MHISTFSLIFVMMKIEIDEGSGFCFGVTTAIRKAEEELGENNKLYCLGDIVHNGMECERLKKIGLITIDHAQMQNLKSAKVLLRAHGEPPVTYELAKHNGINIIDATCPVVLQLQRKVRAEWQKTMGTKAQIVIFGKRGHAEVLGLVGQTDGQAIVVENLEDVKNKLNLEEDIILFSQTTKSLDEFRAIIDYIQKYISPKACFRSYDTICRQVANRMPNISNFARRHDLVLFVAGTKSSNGHVLYEECKRVNPSTKLIEGPKQIQKEWLKNLETIGICGATSTPKWLMEDCQKAILSIVK